MGEYHDKRPDCFCGCGYGDCIVIMWRERAFKAEKKLNDIKRWANDQEICVENYQCDRCIGEISAKQQVIFILEKE